VDEQGRIVLPLDWRTRELNESKDVIIIKGKGFLKIIPKKKIDITKFFDDLDFETNISDWNEFEKKVKKL
jgi:bifunctional DNA-binding transcriptional regulator/antitoxin component of YhaV-PrlF toxin-antitoxin module